MSKNLSFSVNEQPTIGAPPIGIDHPADPFGTDWPASLLDIQQRTRKLMEFGGFVVDELRTARQEMERFQSGLMEQLTEWTDTERSMRKDEIARVAAAVQSHGDQITRLHARLNHLESKIEFGLTQAEANLTQWAESHRAGLHAVESTLLTRLDTLHAISQRRWWRTLWSWVKRGTWHAPR